MKQLQKILNEAIKMGWKPRGSSYGYYDLNQKELDRHVICDQYGVAIERSPESENFLNYSYHELFSKDSGLMEFMGWKGTGNIGLTIVGLNGYKLEKNKDFLTSKEQLEYVSIPNNELNYHYMIMGSMMAQEKIDYFNSNAHLPGTKS